MCDNSNLAKGFAVVGAVGSIGRLIVGIECDGFCVHVVMDGLIAGVFLGWVLGPTCQQVHPV